MNLYLITDTVFDLLMIAAGIILIFKSQGNTMRLVFGILGTVIGLIFVDDNINMLMRSGWPMITHGYSYADILVPGRMMEWILPATACSLFPLMSLRPGFLTPLRLVLLAIPIGTAMLVEWSYVAFNGHITLLHNLADVVANIGETDVKVRLSFFLAGVIVPAVYFFLPFFWRFSLLKRKTTPMMWVFIASLMALLVYYSFFMLTPSKFLFGTFNVAVEIFFIVFSVIFLLHDGDPLSSREASGRYIIPSLPSLQESLYADIEAWFEHNHPFTDPGYALADLARDLNAKPLLVSGAIKTAGFSGFREHMNYLRVEYFKRLAQERHNKSIKELMYESGFTSRSSFYRLFSGYEGITPSEYINRINRL